MIARDPGKQARRSPSGIKRYSNLHARKGVVKRRDEKITGDSPPMNGPFIV